MKQMIQYIPKVLTLLGLLAPGLVFGVTARELDAKEAHINEQWKRVEELGHIHARLAFIRDQTINKDYKALTRQWYEDARKWLNGWQDIVNAMQGKALSNERAAEYNVELARTRLAELVAFKTRIDDIHAAGDRIIKELDDMRILPVNYLDVVPGQTADDYSQQIKLLNQQIADAKQQMIAMRSSLNQGSYQKLEAYGQTMRDKLKAKVAVLALTYDGLQSVVGKIQFGLFTMRVLDEELQTIMTQEGPVNDALNSKRIYEAVEKNNQLLEKAYALKARIEGNATLLPEVKENALVRLEMMIDRWEERFALYYERTGGTYTDYARDLFVTRYNDEVRPGQIMYMVCQNPKKASRFDCNLLRTIVGFTPAQLRKLTPDQARYIEELITRIKQGPIRIGKAN